jgi:hypothetical protein
MKGFEEYNHLFVHSLNLSTKQNIVTKIILLGKHNNKVKRITFDLLKKELIEDEIEFGKEFNNKPTAGWKQGIKEGKPTYNIV